MLNGKAGRRPPNRRCATTSTSGVRPSERLTICAACGHEWQKFAKAPDAALVDYRAAVLAVLPSLPQSARIEGVGAAGVKGRIERRIEDRIAGMHRAKIVTYVQQVAAPLAQVLFRQEGYCSRQLSSMHRRYAVDIPCPYLQQRPLLGLHLACRRPLPQAPHGSSPDFSPAFRPAFRRPSLRGLFAPRAHHRSRTCPR